MLLLDRLGAGGSYTEFYALDFDEEFVLMGHDGPGHLAIAEGRPVARALKLYHGKAGAGLSIEMKVRLGPVTILGAHADRGRPAQADRRRGRVDPRADVPDRQHELAHPLRAGPGRVLRRLVRARARRTTSRSASATSSARIRKIADLLGLELAVVA